MKRTKKPTKAPKSTPDAILTADWHIREDVPTCRTDDFQAAQWHKVRQVVHLQNQYNCPVLHAGDLFHHWKPSPALLSRCMQELPRKFHTVYGQHDLPQHNLDLAWKSGIHTLEMADRLGVLFDGHWGQVPEEGFVLGYVTEEGYRNEKRVAVWHHLTYTTPPFPGATGGMAEKVLRKLKNFDLILTGDNHQQFVTKYKYRVLVNPGPLTRQKASEYKHRPAVYLYYAATNTVEPYYLDADPEVVSREHLERKEERDERIDAFVQRLDTGWEGSLNFKDNLKQFQETNDIPKPVMDIVYKAMEEV